MFSTGLINEDPQKFGIVSGAYRLWLVIDIALMYGLLNGYVWAVNGYKIALAFYALQNFVSYLNPVRGVKLYARNKPLSPLVVSSLRTTANNGLIFCIQTAALLSGVDTLTSIGYA